MISDELFDQVVSAHAANDDETLERLARQNVPVNVVLYVAHEGGALVYDDEGLLERIAAIGPTVQTPSVKSR